MERRILVAEDECLFAQLLNDALGGKGRIIDHAENGKTALEMASCNDYDLIITDIHMPEMNGRRFLEALRDFDQTTGIIVLTAFPSVDHIKGFNDLDIIEFFVKGEIDLIALQSTVDKYFKKKDIEFLTQF